VAVAECDADLGDQPGWPELPCSVCRSLRA
jgi:hypothetical protein